MTISKINLANAEIETSRLAFGTSRLHYINKHARQNLLAAAADLGFVHFDTAPAYGDGLAERELGRFFKPHRNRFIIVTKYGIRLDPIIEAARVFSPPLRVARALARRIGLWHYQQPPISANGLRKSVETSLRRLQTDRIDILLLHEPSLERVKRPAEVLEEIYRLKKQGMIRAFGLAGSWIGVREVQLELPEIAQVVQTSESEWSPASPPDITYGAISGGRQDYLAAAATPEVAAKRLRTALRRRPKGSVIISTTKIDNLRHLVDAATGL